MRWPQNSTHKVVPLGIDMNERIGGIRNGSCSAARESVGCGSLPGEHTVPRTPKTATKQSDLKILNSAKQDCLTRLFTI